MGTIWYAAPEQFVADAPDSKKIDIFAFGSIMYEIVTGAAVFSSCESQTRVLRRIRARNFPILPDGFGQLMQGLIRRCWSEDPRERPSFELIFAEFENCSFRILPGANGDEIKQSVDWLLAVEGKRKAQTL
jgi:serine/threonine protein kinase